jgi:CRP-like cAMP-binding protein
VDKKLELLATVPLFARLDSGGLVEVGRLADEIDLRDGQTLLRQGANAHEFFLIIEGTVSVVRDGTALATLGAGDFLGEIALIDGGQRTATATAVGPVRVLVMGTREFRSLLARFPEINAAVLDALAVRVRSHEPIDD